MGKVEVAVIKAPRKSADERDGQTIKGRLAVLLAARYYHEC